MADSPRIVPSWSRFFFLQSAYGDQGSTVRVQLMRKTVVTTAKIIILFRFFVLFANFAV